MAKLSHIEDFEDGGARLAGQGGKGLRPGAFRDDARAPEAVAAAFEAPGEAVSADGGLPQTASDELAWHGLDERPGGGGRKAIVAVALVVLAAVVLYVLNYWLRVF